MKFRRTLIAASLAAAPFMVASHAMADTLMAQARGPVSAQQSTAVVATLTSQLVNRGYGIDHGYAAANQHPGVSGTTIHRLDHTYKNVRVLGSESIVVTNTSGNIVSESVSDRRPRAHNGVAIASELNTTPTISAAAAIAAVVKSIAPNGSHMVPASAELVLYPVITRTRVASAVNKAESELNALDLQDVVKGYELAYLVKTRLVKDNKHALHDTIVSASDAHVIKQYSAMHNVVGTGHSQYNGDVPINTTLSGGTYQMIDSSRGTGGTYGAMAITNANHGTTAGSVYTNTTNVWGDGLNYNGGSTTNANGQTAAVNALWGLMNTYDMLKNTLGWLSLDGRNTATYIAAHVNTAYDNAYYSDTCKCMFIGDGSSFYSLGSIDVIGHEMSHGVTAATSNLTYSGESGGLNESNSDIGGEMVEAYARAGGTGTTIPGGNDWMMGVEISKTGQPLRWMYKPSKDGSSKDAWSSAIASQDVHYSSGPNNRMFYFLSQGSNASSTSDYYSAYLTNGAMTGIGNDKAYRIWFKASTTKFTASTNYADARAKVLLAAQELYGTNSCEAVAVTRAYAAINVGTDISPACGGAPAPVTVSNPASMTVAVGGTATFSVTAANGTAPYSYQWYRNNVAVSGATSATYSLANAQTTDSGAKFHATVTDSATTPTTATSADATLTVGSGPKELILNGGFESGATSWSGTTAAIGAWTGEAPYAGTKNAWLGGNGKATTETLYQSIAIPSTATSASLTFRLHIDTAESGSTAYDKLSVKVRNSAGTTLATLATYSNVSAATGYVLRTFDLSAYKGQTVQVYFTETEDSSLQTSFVIDNVSVAVQ